MAKKVAIHTKVSEKRKTKVTEEKEFPFFGKKEKKAGVERPTRFKFSNKPKGK